MAPSRFTWCLAAFMTLVATSHVMCCAVCDKLNDVPIKVFVSPGGNDSFSGSSPAAAVRSIAVAIALANRARNDNVSVAVGVMMAPGTYDLGAPLELGRTASKLRFVAYAGEATLSGALPVKALPTNVAPDVYVVRLAPTDLEFDDHIWQLWTPGTGAWRRRSPNVLFGGTVQYDSMLKTEFPTVTVSGNLKAKLMQADLSQAFAYVYHSWTSSLAAVQHFDATTGVLQFATQMPDNVYNTASGRRFRIVNALTNASALPDPGSFFYNATDRTLTYRRDGHDLVGANGEITLLIPRLIHVVMGNGASDVVLHGIRVAGTNSGLSRYCLSTSCDGQSANALGSCSIQLTNVDDWIISNVTLAHHGGFGVWVRANSTNVAMEQLLITDVGAGAVRIGEDGGGDSVASGIVLRNSVLSNGGNVIESGPGVLIQVAKNVAILHNSVHDFYYTGISVGWSWQYGPTAVSNITVRKNNIFNIGRGRLSDMGCIYTLGYLPQTRIDGNVCHDVQSYGYGGQGLYTDQASEGVVFTNNIVYRVKNALLLQHFGLNNVFYNNVLAFDQQIDMGSDTWNGEFGGIYSAQGSEPSSFSFSYNIVLLRNLTSQLFIGSRRNAFLNSTFDHNCYWNEAVAPAQLTFPCRTGACTFAAWQDEGFDSNSTVADPEFPFANRYDFSTIALSSPCVKRGFRPIDTSDVGPAL